MKFYGRRSVALTLAAMMTFSSFGNQVSSVFNELKPDSYSYVVKSESEDLASLSDADTEETFDI